MKITDVTVKTRSYRGNTNYTVEWKADGFPDQCDFKTEGEAKQYADSLIKKSQDSSSEAARTAALIADLNTSHADLNKFLASLKGKATQGLEKWLAYVEKSVATRESLNALAFDQSLTAEAYIGKLAVFKGIDIDKVHEVYKSYTAGQRQTEEYLGEFMDTIRLEEGDEDEVEFIERKLRRFLESVEFNISVVENDTISSYLDTQKGSVNVKSRLLDIIVEFKSFADKKNETVS